MRITNVSRGPRGVNTMAGLLMLAPGEAAEAEVSDAEAAIASGTGWFEIVGDDPAGEKPKRGRPRKAEAPVEDDTEDGA